MDIRIAARKSDLARLQAHQVGNQLKNLGHKVEYYFRQSLGDINQDDPLWKMPEKGVFTEDFREGLVAGQWDMVVHSWKDLPIEILEATELVATLPRADVRDLLLFKKDNWENVKSSKKLRVFSSSPRRIYNLTPFLKDHLPFDLNQVEFESVRGNILTRMTKMMENSDIDGLVVAKAAIDRLLTVTDEEFLTGQNEIKKILEDCLWQVLPIKANPTAAAQGALAVEISQTRQDLKTELSKINCQQTWNEVVTERKVLKSYGGGCHQKIGTNCLTRSYGTLQVLRGETEAGEVLCELSQSDLNIQLKNPLKKWPSLFSRKTIEPKVEKNLNAHLVAKSVAIPDGFQFDADHVLWCSGTDSWKKMAARGYWVHGCSESLGESEDLRLQSLAGDRKWAKWSHSSGYETPDKTLVPTYELELGPVPSELAQYQEYYWMSGSQFKAVTEKYPEILKAQHFCGPGNTFTILCEVLKNHNIKNKPQVLASYDLWKQLCEEFDERNV